MTGGGPEARKLAAQNEWHPYRLCADLASPNNAAIPNWPRYNLETRPTMIWDMPSRIQNDPRGEERRLIARAPYIQPGT